MNPIVQILLPLMPAIMTPFMSYLLFKLFRVKANEMILMHIFELIRELIYDIAEQNNRTLIQQKAEVIRTLEHSLDFKELKLVRKEYGTLKHMVEVAYTDLKPVLQSNSLDYS